MAAPMYVFLPCPHVRRMMRMFRRLFDRRLRDEGVRIHDMMERGEPVTSDDLVGYARAISGFRDR
jgi:hypothetical protein